MTAQMVLDFIVQNQAALLLGVTVLMTFVEIVPIKINPWSAIFRWFGKQINKEVITKIDAIEKRLDGHIEESEKNELRSRRTNILDFSSSIIRGVNYHREKFDFMITECDSYEKYCKDNGIKNGVAEASIAEIRRIYQEHLRNNDFLSHAGFVNNNQKVVARKEETQPGAAS